MTGHRKRAGLSPRCYRPSSASPEAAARPFLGDGVGFGLPGTWTRTEDWKSWFPQYTARHGAARGCLLEAESFKGSYTSRRRTEVRMATTFRRIRIQATVETPPMLVTEEQVAAALQELRDRLTRRELAIVGIEAKEEAPVELPDSVEYRD